MQNARSIRTTPTPVEVSFEMNGRNVERSIASNGSPYAKFTDGNRTVMAFGELADVASDTMTLVGMGIENGRMLKIVGARPFEHRSTMINENGDNYDEHGPATRQAA